MSRIGNRKLTLPKDVEIDIKNQNFVILKGPKGRLEKWLPEEIEIKVENGVISTIRKSEIKKYKQLHGTTNSLLEGMIVGVTKGFIKKLNIVGVGYRATTDGKYITLNLGYSHPIKFKIPENINISIPKPIEIIIQGIDKQLVGETAAKIREFRKPEPYKGKGIKYSDEHILRKEGKSAGK